MDKNCLPLIGKAVFLALGLAIASSVQAAPILRIEFNSNATNYGLANATVNATTATDGEVTLTNGRVFSITAANLIEPAYYDGGDASVITFSFANPVSAFGLEWMANKANPTLSVFDSGNNLLESLTLDRTNFPEFNSLQYGFIGIDLGSNSIAYATIDTPLNGNELFVDNLIYQTVPEPATLGLFVLGAGLLRRKLPSNL